MRQVNYMVPFSWEYKPGLSKLIVTPQQEEEDNTTNSNDDFNKSNLRTPAPSTRISTLPLPLPLPPSRTFSRKGGLISNQDDPFFKAYKECTKTSESDNKVSKKGLLRFSCKHSCSVVDHNLVMRVRVRDNQKNHY